MENLIVESRIDTLQTREKLDNRKNNELEEIKGVDMYLLKESTLITKYNPNNIVDLYSNEYSLSHTINNFNYMKKLLGVIDENKIEIKRVDVASDLSVPFNKGSKFFDLTHKCLRGEEVDGKAWHNVDEVDLEISNFLYKKKGSLEIEFYDKRKQNPNAKYPTRLEIRFLRTSSKDLKYHVKNAIKKWEDMSDNLEVVEKKMVKILIEKFKEEKRINEHLKFNTFVYKYSKYMYTQAILKAVYREANLKREFSSWLQDYRKCYYIEFYTKTYLNKFSKQIIKSLKEYLKR